MSPALGRPIPGRKGWAWRRLRQDSLEPRHCALLGTRVDKCVKVTRLHLSHSGDSETLSCWTLAGGEIRACREGSPAQEGAREPVAGGRVTQAAAGPPGQRQPDEGPRAWGAQGTWPHSSGGLSTQVLSRLLCPAPPTDTCQTVTSVPSPSQKPRQTLPHVSWLGLGPANPLPWALPTPDP